MELLVVVILIILAWAYISPKWQKAMRKAERQVRVQQRRKLTHVSFKKYQIANEVRICRESMKIISESKSIEVILGRIETLHQSTSRLRELVGTRRLARTPELLELAEMTLATRIDLTRQAIEHTLELAIQDAMTLKTERGQMNRIAGYFRKLESLSASIPSELYPWIRNKAEEHNTTFTVPLTVTIGDSE